ncbi:hypothetical protein Dsin_008283 [Dipteronia sinensis]|uniref:Clp R domain-containing protein n=1 Tax=Dipteronia sinensis TaxID=43782 RepID=A0AAE0EAI9_9ROSI|nr:hypothetical protein Dsin_008283 [Dipteronia sinensis]
MRSGGCAVQQTLTTEAASVLKHSLSLARRRGHAQVTPLHVAATLLSSRTSLLRRACLKSQPHQSSPSHPLQCRALELCFNVALNRLPTTPGPLLHGQPSLSNALIAALKRAQAHQRRGCIEQQQQQPLLTIKVELEQLIISILDDPSVSRVMREAGFSSTSVKNHIEDSSASSVFQCYTTNSGGVFSSPCSPSQSDHTQNLHNHHNQHPIINPNTFWQTHFLTYSSEQNPLLFSPQKKVSTHLEDIKLVFEVLLRKNKRKNTVIVGDCFSVTEGLVSELMGRVERDDVPDELKQTHFIKFQFAPVTLRFMKKEDVEMNLTELKRKVDALTSAGGGAIIYTGDLKWTVDHQENLSSGDQISYYSPVNHLVAELARLVSDFKTSNSKVWLVATASFQTYRRCQMKEPPLEIQWGLQAVSVPSGGLGLSLHTSSVHDSRLSFSQSSSPVRETKLFTCKEEEDNKLNCCAECTSNYENEAQLFKSGQQKLLPPWLQPHTAANANQKDELVEMKRKWNRLCHSLHQGIRHAQSLIGKSYSYASSYPWWPTQSTIFPDSNSISFAESALKHNNSPHSVPKFRRQQSCSTIEFDFGISTHKLQGGDQPSLDSLKTSEGKEVKITLALGSSVFSDSGNSEKVGNGRAIQRNDLSKALQETVPWQCETIPSIVDSLIESKSIKKETWLLIQGNDTIGKKRLALAIAELVLGSADLLFCINMSKRNDDVSQFSELLIQNLKNHEKLVVFVEDVHLADSKFMKLLADRFETGKFGESREEKSGQIIFILAEGGDSSSNYEDSVIPMTLKINERIPTSDQKRKAEWDCSNKIKSPRVEEKEDIASSIAIDNVSSKKDFSRQSSFNTLDLNMKADDEIEEKMGELSPISSDLTRETSTNPANSNGFLNLIRNHFVFNRNSTKDREIKGVFLARFQECFEEVFGGQERVSFSVEDRVLEEVFIGSCSFLNSLFDKWLKEVFQTSLNTVKLGEKEGGIRVIRLSFGGIIGNVTQGGFKDSRLPKNITFSSMD